VRAVDYLSSREDVDGDRIAVWGGSQGGGLAFATAALDQRVDLCIADIPWLCDWKNYFELAGKTDDEEINAWLAAKESRTVESTLTTLSYFDTMNLAHLIECPTLMGVGLQDTICPPSTSFATFNRITAPKDFRIYEDAGHGLGREHYGWIFSELAERFTARAR
jgi:cephalosporin-C deacetylase